MRLGDTVKIIFDDHSEGGDELLRFIVFGRLVHKTRTMLSVQGWCYEDLRTESDDNCHQWNISRKSILCTKVLEEAEG